MVLQFVATINLYIWIFVCLMMEMRLTVHNALLNFGFTHFCRWPAETYTIVWQSTKLKTWCYVFSPNQITANQVVFGHSHFYADMTPKCNMRFTYSMVLYANLKWTNNSAMIAKIILFYCCCFTLWLIYFNCQILYVKIPSIHLLHSSVNMCTALWWPVGCLWPPFGSSLTDH